ncbi:MAG: hypothetical protein RL189_1232 [Pseudomonadota bacterium]|jgi:uncharacterized protein YaiL (DUF2058 family)
MSLRDQFLKAGLVSKKQAKQAESQAKQKEHQAKKNKVVADEVAAEREADLREIERERLEKQQHDRELNMIREQQRLERENYLRCLQLMKSNAANENRASEIYYFLESGRFVRKVMVTPWQREMLARGKMAIGRLTELVDEFVIIPYTVAQTVMNLHPSLVITLHSEVADDREVQLAE